jgi:hypothetical protein
MQSASSHSLKNSTQLTQIWYADDASAGAKLQEVRGWFDKLCRDGPAYGYFPETTKSYLVVADSDLETGQKRFSDLGVKVMRGHIGSKDGLEAYLHKKVSE